MADVIHKISIPVRDTLNALSIMMDEGSEILSAANVNEELAIWYTTNPLKARKKRTLFLVCTGELVPERVKRFIGTVAFLEGAYILHIYESES